MFNVVFRTIVDGTHKGVITWSSFKDEAEFNKWYGKKMQSWYEVVDKGVSAEKAIELCSTPEATLAGIRATCAETTQMLREILEGAVEV